MKTLAISDLFKNIPKKRRLFLTLTPRRVHKKTYLPSSSLENICSDGAFDSILSTMYHLFFRSESIHRPGGNIMRVPIRILVEGALCIALSVALSFVKLFALPQGGSVSLGMLPIFIFAIRRGGTAGVSAGLAVGMLKLFLGGYVIHPVQALLDYPAANALIGTAGYFRTKIYWGVAAASILNLLASVLSGVVFFAEYAPEGMNVWLYSFIYNASVVIPEAVICSALVYFILPRLDNIRR